MRDWLVIGGTARPDQARRREWEHFEKGVVLSVDRTTHAVKKLHEYSSPPEVCPDIPSVVFKAGTLRGERLYLCTQTEVLVYRLPDFVLEQYVSLPCFNDLHHVTPTNRDTILAVVTGLDLVVEIDRDGNVTEEWSVLGTDTWTQFSRAIDYRKVPTTQPHAAHPNYAFMLGDEVWATRCDLKDAVCLTHDQKRIDLSGAGFQESVMVHDGLLHGDRLYFTSVNGTVLVADPKSCQVIDVIDLRDIVRSDYPLGWCRGVEVLDDERMIVGFSRLRRTKLTDKVSWAKAQVKRVFGVGDFMQTLPSLPTRICCFNLRTREEEWQLPLSEHGIDAVFSIL